MASCASSFQEALQCADCCSGDSAMLSPNGVPNGSAGIESNGEPTPSPVVPKKRRHDAAGPRGPSLSLKLGCESAAGKEPGKGTPGKGKKKCRACGALCAVSSSSHLFLIISEYHQKRGPPTASPCLLHTCLRSKAPPTSNAPILPSTSPPWASLLQPAVSREDLFQKPPRNPQSARPRLCHPRLHAH